jgi:hypothetical protein
MSVSYGGDSITFADGSTVASGYTGFKNRVINGAMRFDQRHLGNNSLPTTSVYVIDRWKYTTNISSKLTFKQLNGVQSDASNYESGGSPTNFSNSLKITTTTAYTSSSTDYLVLEHRIEGFNLADLNWGTANAKPVTLSFWMKSSLTGSHSGCIENFDGSRTYAYTFTVNQANTWEQKTITVPGSTDGSWIKTNELGMYIKFNLGSGSSRLTGTTNSWITSVADGVTGSVNLAANSGATFYLTGVQLEVGSTASTFDYVDFATELQRCQRYCVAFDNRTVNNISGGGMTYYHFGLGSWSATTSAFINMKWPVQMRGQPSLYSNSAGNTFFVDPGVTNFTNVTLDQIGSTSGAVLLTGGSGGYSAGGAGRALSNSNAQAYLIFSAEL